MAKEDLFISRGDRGRVLYALYNETLDKNRELKAKLERYKAIVTCGECRFCAINENSGNRHCTTYHGIKGIVTPHDFCSHGERK